MRSRHVVGAAFACGALALAGCGSSSEGGGSSSPNATAAPASSPALEQARHPVASEFPRAQGRSLRQIANTLTPGPQVGLATSLYTPGENRLAFGVIDANNEFVYGRSAVYVARRPDGPAKGPFLAPADSLEVRTAFRSQTSNQVAGDVKAVYHADVGLPSAGRWYVLVATRLGDRTYGATADLKVVKSTRIPSVGQMAPSVDTPTLASVGNDVSKIDTRTPPDTMHAYDLRDVLGRRPVLLLFATPLLCQSRVCGPVTDIAEQLKAAYGDRAAFIHNEVYNDNQVAKGLRPQLVAYGLHTEPWLFAIDRDGRVVDRLEGAFGVDEFRQAITDAIDGTPQKG
jgi:hypothetical protein